VLSRTLAEPFFRKTTKNPNSTSKANLGLPNKMDYQRLSPGNASPSYSAQKLRAIEGVLRSNYLYSLLIFVPLGIFFGTLGANPTIVFVFNMLAIVPLAMLLSFGTEELSANSGQAVGELLNASFGNAVEMIVSWIQGPSKICC
jgi:hypothetical protein